MPLQHPLVSPPSLPGLTRQSIFFAKRVLRLGWTRGSSPRATPEKEARLPFVNRLLRTVAERVSSHPRSFDAQGDNMTALSLSEAPGATGVAKITITGALKSRWHAATRKHNGGYEIDTVAPASSERRVRSLLPWRRAAEARADAELRQQLAVAEQQLADLKTALGSFG